MVMRRLLLAVAALAAAAAHGPRGRSVFLDLCTSVAPHATVS
jgi:hypothetical protein